jgi:hypothetical protein
MKQSHHDFDQLLNVLTMRQHLAPHAALRESLRRLVAELDVCPQAIEQSLAWLKLDGSKSIGRLRRTELMQLARTIYRIWQQRLNEIAATLTT